MAPGAFRLTVSSEGFEAQTVSGVLSPGEVHVVPEISLPLAAVVTEVQVGLSRTELAEEQVKQKRSSACCTSFPISMSATIPSALPLTSKQKFQLAWKTTIDPVTFGLTAGIAGIQQAQNHFSGYGQGAQGYAKRYGAAYGDFVSGTFVGSAILPSPSQAGSRAISTREPEASGPDPLRDRQCGNLQG